jgi:hypothetical protein
MQAVEQQGNPSLTPEHMHAHQPVQVKGCLTVSGKLKGE